MLTKLMKNKFEEKKIEKNYYLKFYFVFSIINARFMPFYLSKAFSLLTTFCCFVYILSVHVIFSIHVFLSVHVYFIWIKKITLLMTQSNEMTWKGKTA